MNGLCGCCQPPIPLTPVAIDNRPGLSAIAYRIGTYPSFRETMLEAIAKTPELSGLGTRRDNDYSITLLDLWAAVAEVLTFYQERYANEVFLRTAQQVVSLKRLAGLLGYDPAPGVAATAELAFTADTGKVIQVPVGLRVQSAPAQNQQPQTFETLEAATVDWRFNNLRIYPKPSPNNPLQQNSSQVVLGRRNAPQIAAGFAPDDQVVIYNDYGSDPVEEKKIKQLDVQDDREIVTWTQPVQANTWSALSEADKFRRKMQLFAYNVQTPWFHAKTDSTVPGGIAWFFDTSLDFSLPAQPDYYLDSRYSDLATGTLLLFVIPTGGGIQTIARTVVQVGQAQRTFGPLTDTVTHVILDAALPACADIRSAIVYELTGEYLLFWDATYDSTISSGTVYLPGMLVEDEVGVGVEVGRTISQNGYVPGVVIHPQDIEVGRKFLLTDADNPPVEATLHSPPVIDPPLSFVDSFVHLVLTLDAASVSLQTDSAVLFGNVLLASQGETVPNEVVGSGDASQKFQNFELQKQPLTYVPGSGPDGVSSSLSVRVNGLLWQEVPGLYEQPANAQVYSTSTAEDGRRLIQFGDGAVGGAVLPTGTGNITATYRVGTGVAGRVSANALTTLLDRLQGLTSVTNPLSAEGGADPEPLAMIRSNAPRTVRTFGRAVSLQDFADLITASGEVAKAEAVWIWDGLAPAVFLSVAGQAGGTFSDPASLAANLNMERDPNRRLLVGNFQRVPIVLSAKVLVQPQYVADDVLTAVLAVLLESLSFDNLNLGQSIHLSVVYSVMQAVAGVEAVDITLLGFRQPDGMSAADFNVYLDRRGVERLSDGSVAPVQDFLRIFSARPDSSTPGLVQPAELAWVEAPGQDISIVTQAS
jgi:uncharacterized phage protein gp47/JayE